MSTFFLRDMNLQRPPSFDRSDSISSESEPISIDFTIDEVGVNLLNFTCMAELIHLIVRLLCLILCKTLRKQTAQRIKAVQTSCIGVNIFMFKFQLHIRYLCNFSVQP